MLTSLRSMSQRIRVVLVLAVVAAAAIVILACGGGAVTTSANGGNSSGTSTSAPAKVGATITESGVSCTLTSVKKINGDEFTKPKAGNIFIVVHVKIVNKSGSEFDYNAFDFHAKSGSGNITDVEIAPSTYTANNELQSGTLANGGTVEGDMVFQVPQGDHKAELTWQPSIFDDKTGNAWNLGL